MGRLEDEYKEWNTPVIGSYLLWQFCIGYYENSERAPSIIEATFAYVLLTDKDYLDNITGHKPNFSSFIRSFTKEKQSDLLLCFSEKLKEKIEYAFKAVDIAVAAGLIAWDSEKATLIPIMKLKNKTGTARLGSAIKANKKKANLLGKWFSKNNIEIISNSLGVIL